MVKRYLPADLTEWSEPADFLAACEISQCRWFSRTTRRLGSQTTIRTGFTTPGSLTLTRTHSLSLSYAGQTPKWRNANGSDLKSYSCTHNVYGKTTDIFRAGHSHGGGIGQVGSKTEMALAPI